MAYMQGKTPISFLQEFCTKHNLNPKYELIATEGAVHEPSFVFKVTAGQFQGTGVGSSKRKAKHNAALSALEPALGVVNGAEDLSALIPGGENIIGNPVGELQEMTQKRLWPPPVYEYAASTDVKNVKEFICTVKLWKFVEKGVGKTKKSAKKAGAQLMLERVNELEKSGQLGQPGPDELYVPAAMSYASLKDDKKLATLTPQASQQISEFYNGLKADPGPTLRRVLLNPLTSLNAAYTNILKDVAAEQRFEVTYVHVAERSDSGEHQCLVQLSTMPVAVCHGTAPTTEECRARAACNALQYLKIMSIK